MDKPIAQLFGELAAEFNANPRLPHTKAGAMFTKAAMTYLNMDGAGGSLEAEHARKFVHEMLGLTTDWADYLAKTDIDLIGPTGRVLDDWELADVGDIRKHQENVETEHTAGETMTNRKIKPDIIDLIVVPSYERIGRWLRRSIGEGAKLGDGVNIILKEIMKKMRRELQNLWINGDDESAQPHLVIQKGWIKYILTEGLAANKNGTEWDTEPDVKAMCIRMRRRATLVRHGELLNNPNLAYTMSQWLHDILVDQLSNATTDSGHKLYFVDPDGVRRFRGIPIDTPNYLPHDFCRLGLSKNLGCGISDEISRDIPMIEYTRKSRKGAHEFVCRVSGGCNIAKPDIEIVEYNSLNTTYEEWVNPTP